MHSRGTPVVVVGAGLGGLVTALELAPLPVLLLSRSPLGTELATAWAQGGLAAAVGPGDSPADHAADTHAAGDGLCDAAIVAAVTREAPDCVRRLESLGVRFDRDATGRFALGREGGHGTRRIVHVRDATGSAIADALIAAVRSTPSVGILDGVQVRELLTSDGVVSGVVAQRGVERLRVAARAVVLATGGVGALYRHTSNPLGARGEGLVMAARAGAVLADVEFVQFHPTALDVSADPMPLATEALRGEGALLVNSLGERFMAGRHPLAELAPRDVVARAIYQERAAGRRTFLDAREALGRRFASRFPTVHRSCMAAGIDPATDLIPVAPAAHYHMGGIAVDARGQSSVPGLWAVGEVACTGLHGANRLASNSLLEAAVFGRWAAQHIAAQPAGQLRRAGAHDAASPSAAPPADPDAMAALRSLMDGQVGVVRDAEGLGRAIAGLAALRRDRLDGTVRDAATAGLLMACAAWKRRESRGGHFRSDFASRESAATHGRITLAEAEAMAPAFASQCPPAMALAATG